MHLAMNDVIKRSLYKTSLPSVLEHPELDRRDGSRPDCTTVLPFICGRSLVWDYACVKILMGCTWIGQQLKLAQLQTTLRSTRAVNTLLLQRHISLSQLQSKRWECMVGPLESSWGPIDCRLVEATFEEHRKDNLFRQNLAIAVHRGNAFSILSASWERC